MWVIGPGGATIYPWSGERVTMGARSSFSFIWACLPPDVSLSTTCSDCLIYHWPQIWKCGSLHRGPVTLLRVQSRGIMGEALLQSWEEGGWGGIEGVSSRRNEQPCMSLFFMTPYCFFFKETPTCPELMEVMTNIAALSVDNFYLRAYYTGETTCISLTLCVKFKTNKYTMIQLLSIFKDIWPAAWRQSTLQCCCEIKDVFMIILPCQISYTPHLFIGFP